jgi:hypothetical protein
MARRQRKTTRCAGFTGGLLTYRGEGKAGRCGQRQRSGRYRRPSSGAVMLDLGGELAIEFLWAHSNGRYVVSSHQFEKPPSARLSEWPRLWSLPTWGKLYRNGHFGTHFGPKNLRFSGLSWGFKSLLLHHRFPSFCIPLSASAPRRVPMRWKMLQSLIQRNGYRDLCPQVKPEVLAL